MIFTETPQIVGLAEHILADIRRRGLREGDPYLTTAATAQQFGVSTGAANLALQLLTQRRVLDRRQRKGTTIARTLPEADSPPRLRRVHLLMRRHFVASEGLFTDGQLIGLQGELPDAEFVCRYLTGNDDAADMRQLIGEVLRNRERAGLILVRASLAMQRAAAASGLPAVLSGTPFPSVRGLVSIDKDQHQTGRLLARHLIGKGARWLVVLLREDVRQGDHIMLDGVRDALTERKLRASALTLRCLPEDPLEIETLLTGLAGSQAGRGGVLCRSLPHAQIVREILTGPLGRRFAGQAVCEVYDPASKAVFAHARPVLDPVAWGARLGQMLRAQLDSPGAGHETVPVVVDLPRKRGGPL